MKWTSALIPTLKEDPQDAEVISHKLMVRAGLIRKLFSGAYSYLPLGKKVLDKIETIIREEMDAKGSQEVLLPAMHPPELWKTTGRYEVLGGVLIKFKDRHGKELVLGPTHEEVITDLVAGNVRSYKELPLILYQIQTKFRDEPRPRFGVMRSCEFIMKDAYSFDADEAGLDASYKKMFDAYCRIFERCGLPYLAVEADTGIMGGKTSHEFMVPCEAGEDEIVVCPKCKFASSKEIAKCGEVGNQVTRSPSHQVEQLPLKEVATPGVTTVEKVAELLKVKPSDLIKTLLYKADDAVVAVLVRGDYDISETKVKNHLKAAIFELADEKAIHKATGAPVGFSGPVGLKGVRILADNSVKGISNGVTGANKKDAHLVNVNPGRDFDAKEYGDFRVITADDPCPSCGGAVELRHSLEIGHTFKLGTKYSSVLGAKFLDKDGKERPAIMGCYGIGVNRIAAGLIETSSDKDGIIWPASIAPYEVVVIALNVDNEQVKKTSEEIYTQLAAARYDVIYDDRKESAGKKFKDSDLIGFPVQVIVGERNLKNGAVEVKLRKTGERKEVPVKDVTAYFASILKK
ncbi:MAG: proline--tRNA ligase [Candidatus Omnitrophica bacterium]|nr:proline--tRNA ligase [Candidatus Omnitrophota bacterium]